MLPLSTDTWAVSAASSLKSLLLWDVSGWAACVQQEPFSGAAVWVVPNTFSVCFRELWAVKVNLNPVLEVKDYHKI